MSHDTPPDGLLPPDDDPDFLAGLQPGPLSRAAQAQLAALAEPGSPDAKLVNGQPAVRLSAMRPAVKALLDEVTRLLHALGPFVKRGDTRGLAKMDWTGPLGDAAVTALLETARGHFDGPARVTRSPTEFLVGYAEDEVALAATLLGEARELRQRLLEINGAL